jgi:hypothetical protein
MSFTLVGPAFGADLLVQYDVEQRPFRSVAATTLLTFDLFDNPDCIDTPVYETSMNAGDLDAVEVVKLRKISGGPTPPRTYRLRTQLQNVTTETSELYLKVTGTGIAPVIRACQAQSSTQPRSAVVSNMIEFVYPGSSPAGDQSVTGMGFKPTTLILMCADGAVDLPEGSVGFAGKDGGYAVWRIVSPGSNVSDSTTRIIQVDGGANGARGATLKSLDADGFTVTWTAGGGTVVPDIRCQALGIR